MNKFDTLYEQTMERIDEELIVEIFSSVGKLWLISAIEEYLGTQYGQNKILRGKAIKRMVEALDKKSLIKLQNIIKSYSNENISTSKIHKIFLKILTGKIDLYKIHRSLVDELSDDFNQEKYDKFKDQIFGVVS